MPDDSYMTKYFDHYQTYFEVGPPVYFMITEGFNYSDAASQNKVCGFYDCDRDSVFQRLNYYTTEVANRYVAAERRRMFTVPTMTLKTILYLQVLCLPFQVHFKFKVVITCA